MGQTRWAVTRFKQNMILTGLFTPFEQRACLYKGPSFGRHARIAQIAHGFSHILGRTGVVRHVARPIAAQRWRQ
jgi:hypothetical protein